MKTHVLKTLPQYFEAVADGRKTFEVRLNDRAFQTGDTLKLVKMDETGRFYDTFGQLLFKRITFILQGGQFGIEPRYCVLGLGELQEANHAE